MNKNLQLAQMALPIGSIEAYIQRVNAIPMLTAEEELDCAVRWHQQEDVEAARRLVLAHLRFVVKIAQGYRGYGLTLSDLIQEGNIGLMKAVKRFDPAVGVRLVSFAVHWIKAEIHEFIIKNWRIVKVATTKAQRKLFFNLRRFKHRLGWFNQAEIDEVAKELNVNPSEVLEMEMRLNGQELSLEGDDEDEGGSERAPIHYLEDQKANPADQFEIDNGSEHNQNRLYDALDQLDPRSRDILRQRWLKEEGTTSTLHELAKQYSVSPERIRQLEQNAMKKLKLALV